MRTAGRMAVVVMSSSLLVLAGCSGDDADDGSSAAEPLDPAERLAAAKELLDQATSVALTLDGDVSASGTVLNGARGTVVPPDGFDGEFDVSQSGFDVTVPVISTGGTVWVQLPLTSSYTEVDPADFGVPDPGSLLDPDTGLSTLLVVDPDPTPAGQVRLGSEVLDVFDVDLPPAEIQSALPLGVAATDVDVSFGIDTESGELRQTTLTGDFYGAATDQEYQLVLDEYDADVAIEPPS